MLKKFYLLIGLVFCGFLSGMAQITKEFKVDHKQGFNLVYVDFNVYKGVTEIMRKQGPEPIWMESELSKVNILPSFSYEIKDKVLYAQLVHKNVESENLGKSLSHKLFSSSNDDFDHLWHVGLNSNYLYSLHLNFGIGLAKIDLAHLPVSNCIIKSASADIHLDYSRPYANSVKMDTMSVSLNMGTIEGKQLSLTNAKQMFFDVNYGTINLDLSKKISEPTKIHATMGAGKVNITLPDESQAYIIRIKSTPMSRTYVPKNLREIGNKTYVSRSYHEKASNIMDLTIDVSVGSISLK